MNPKLIEKLHAFADKIGVKPAVIDTFAAAVVFILANWLIGGDPFDIEGLKAAAFALILGGVGIAAPAASGVTQEVVLAAKPELQQVTEIVDPAKPNPENVSGHTEELARRVRSRKRR